jgi:5-methylcytosine-specific restriction endonuclease McrA
MIFDNIKNYINKMSRKYYDIIYMKNKEWDNLLDWYNSSSSKLYYDMVKQTYTLLLEIIDNKTDDEFYDFFKKYMYNFQFKKQYIENCSNINQYGKVISVQLTAINKFHSVIDLIEKCCFISFSSTINKDDFYKELNIFLTNIYNISQKIKEEEHEEKLKKEQEEKLKKEQEEKLKKEQEEKLKKEQEEKLKKEQEEKLKKKKKKSISATIKRLVWNINIGETIGKAKCLCCNSTDITQMSFNCGHIIAEANGGETIVSNLKPICQNCNSSMGTKNMKDFMKTLK